MRIMGAEIAKVIMFLIIREILPQRTSAAAIIIMISMIRITMIMSNDDNDSKDKKNMAKNPLTSEFSNDLNFLHRNSFNFLRNLLEELFYMC